MTKKLKELEKIKEKFIENWNDDSVGSGRKFRYTHSHRAIYDIYKRNRIWSFILSEVIPMTKKMAYKSALRASKKYPIFSSDYGISFDDWLKKRIKK